MKSRPSPPKKPLSNYGKYLSMATYMAVIITLGTLGGKWLDDYFEFKKIPVFTLTLSLFSVGAAMWYFVKDFIKKK